MREDRPAGPVDSVSLQPSEEAFGGEFWAQSLPASAFSTEAAQAVTARNIASLTFDWLTRAFPESQDSEERLLEALLEGLRLLSPHSISHSNRVADLAGALAEELDLSPEEQAAFRSGVELREAGLLGLELSWMKPEERAGLADQIREAGISLREAGRIHDIGKLHVPPGILAKPGPLTPEERALVRLHPVIGEVMLRRFEHLAGVLPAVRGHHERWDGQGYPDGTRGAAIPISARLLCLADSYDAMTGRRPYRDPVSIPEALQEILRNAGRQFDPGLTGLFVTMVARLYV
ncbi:MAG: HD domain-containing phosphohydrolase [Candidatus Eremiobacterota bacterium]